MNKLDINLQTWLYYLTVPVVDANLSGESLAMKISYENQCKVKFLYRQNDFLNLKLSRLMCSSLVKLQFVYASIS